MIDHVSSPRLTETPAQSPADIAIRKVRVMFEQVLRENRRAPSQPCLRAVASAVVENPWLGTDASHDLASATRRIAPPLAKLLTDRLTDALGGDVGEIEAFGKGALVGLDGEIEHGGALIHTPYFGNLMRELLDGESIICFADARVQAGEGLVLPMWNKTRSAARSHYQTITTSLPDAPRRDEIVVIAAASTGPRPHARIGDRSTDEPVTAQILEAPSP